MPLQVPKEIWLLVDHLFKHACRQVRERPLPCRGALQSLVTWFSSGWRSAPAWCLQGGAFPLCWRLWPGLPAFTSLSPCASGDFVHPCAAFGRRTCSRLQACRKSWSTSLTAWTPVSLRQSVSSLRLAVPGACWSSALLGELRGRAWLQPLAGKAPPGGQLPPSPQR